MARTSLSEGTCLGSLSLSPSSRRDVGGAWSPLPVSPPGASPDSPVKKIM